MPEGVLRHPTHRSCEAEPLRHGPPGDDTREAADGVDAPRRHPAVAVAVRVPMHAAADDLRERDVRCAAACKKSAQIWAE